MNVEFKDAEQMDVTFGSSESFDAGLYDAPVYEGPYEFTPSNETQTVQIRHKEALTDITINPIPSNYGLITWDGSTITVS